MNRRCIFGVSAINVDAWLFPWGILGASWCILVYHPVHPRCIFDTCSCPFVSMRHPRCIIGAPMYLNIHNQCLDIPMRHLWCILGVSLVYYRHMLMFSYFDAASMCILCILRAFLVCGESSHPLTWCHTSFWNSAIAWGSQVNLETTSIWKRPLN